jgi:hypothetical protein
VHEGTRRVCPAAADERHSVPDIPQEVRSKAIAKTPAEFLAPAPDRLIRDDNITLSQERLDIPQAETEHMLQPDSMADNLGGKSDVGSEGQGDGFMPSLLSRAVLATRGGYRER